MLRDSRRLRGTSLAREAWRRLLRQWTAVVSLAFLTGVILLAIFTPLLPLQPPRSVSLPRQYLSPQVGLDYPLWIAVPDLPESLDAAEAEKLLADGFGAPLSDQAGLGGDALDPFSHWLLRQRVALFGNSAWNSFCGTDSQGRDLLSRICWGARVSLAVAAVAASVSLVIGVLYGAIAGYCGGRIDNLLMRIVDVLYSIPIIFVAIFLITILDAKNYAEELAAWGIGRMTIFFVVIGALYWLTMARVVRGQVLSLKQNQFVEAARAMGAGPARIIWRHLVPNVISVVIVYLTLTIPSIMLTEAFLSFLGLGVRAPDVSWGLLANEGVRVITPIKTYWWLIVFPSLAMGLTLYSLNFLGDGLRDALDPRLKRRS